MRFHLILSVLIHKLHRQFGERGEHKTYFHLCEGEWVTKKPTAVTLKTYFILENKNQNWQPIIILTSKSVRLSAVRVSEQLHSCTRTTKYYQQLMSRIF